MGIDVSGLSLAPVPLDVLNTAVGSTGVWTDASNALIIIGGLTYLAYEKRPRGSARDDLIEKRKSTVKEVSFEEAISSGFQIMITQGGQEVK